MFIKLSTLSQALTQPRKLGAKTLQATELHVDGYIFIIGATS